LKVQDQLMDRYPKIASTLRMLGAWNWGF